MNITWLKNQCNRCLYGQCTAAVCLMRGGHQPGTPPDYACATCEAWELINQIEVMESDSFSSSELSELRERIFAEFQSAMNSQRMNGLAESHFRSAAAIVYREFEALLSPQSPQSDEWEWNQ